MNCRQCNKSIKKLAKSQRRSAKEGGYNCIKCAYKIMYLTSKGTADKKRDGSLPSSLSKGTADKKARSKLAKQPPDDNCIKCNLPTNRTRSCAKTVTDRMIYVLEQNVPFELDKSKKSICIGCEKMVSDLIKKNERINRCIKCNIQTDKTETDAKTRCIVTQQILHVLERNGPYELDKLKQYICKKCEDFVRDLISQEEPSECIYCNKQTDQTKEDVKKRCSETEWAMYVLEMNEIFEFDATKKYICKECLKMVRDLFIVRNDNSQTGELTIGQVGQMGHKNLDVKTTPTQVEYLLETQKYCIVCYQRLKTGFTSLSDNCLRKNIEELLGAEHLHELHVVCNKCKLKVESIDKELQIRKRLQIKAALGCAKRLKHNWKVSSRTIHHIRKASIEGVVKIATNSEQDDIKLRIHVSDRSLTLKFPTAFSKCLYSLCKITGCTYRCFKMSDMISHYIEEHIDYEQIKANMNSSLTKVILEHNGNTSFLENSPSTLLLKGALHQSAVKLENIKIEKSTIADQAGEKKLTSPSIPLTTHIKGGSNDKNESGEYFTPLTDGVWYNSDSPMTDL
ncbi:unnamed protein product [Owenia fusiformis]|uniref:Uncharacterized protein n=1 Tax=Owenia fusiformis TaxID=6347 RepID=A0A8J1T6K6_OWEFU|nr:unnamed protein product [Owenia fusiformis]